jgi:protein phosphatase
MKLSISAASYVGCVRQNNEDMILVNDKFIRNDKYWTMVDLAESDRYIVALADGMGGHSSGEVASEDTLHNLQYYFSDLPSNMSVENFNEAIFEWLSSINNIIDSKGRSDQRFVGMGTTLVAFAYYNKHFYWMNCGDSRFYRMHGSALTQVSTDHSLSNLVGSDEHSNIITNCIGGGCKMSYIDMVQYTPDIVSGDVLLLCSDGLTDMLTDIEILDLLEKGADAMKLCKAAEVAGGFDNVSACVIKVV